MQPNGQTQRRLTELKDALGVLLTGRVCIVGVGNRGRHDDGAGPRLIQQRRPGTTGTWIDAGVAPENYLGSIARTNPDVVLIVDAVNFGGNAGECRLLDSNTGDTFVLSTHAHSLKMLADYLSARTGAKIRVLGIQPQRVDAGEGLSEAVARSLHELAAVLSDLLTDRELRGE